MTVLVTKTFSGNTIRHVMALEYACRRDLDRIRMAQRLKANKYTALWMGCRPAEATTDDAQSIFQKAAVNASASLDARDDSLE